MSTQCRRLWYWMGTFAICLWLVNPAQAMTSTDDLSDGPDAIFNFDFDLGAGGIQGPGATGTDFTGSFDSNDGFTGQAGGLWLFPDQAEITFNLQPNEEISFFQIAGEDFVGPGGTNVRFVGVDAANNPVDVTLPFGPGPWVTDSSSQGLTRVDRVVIDSFEGRFDTIEYTVIPEATSLALLGLGGLMLIRRRRG